MDWVGVVPEVRTYPRQQLSEGGECSIFFLSFRATQKKERPEATREKDTRAHPWLSRSWNKWSLG